MHDKTLNNIEDTLNTLRKTFDTFTEKSEKKNESTVRCKIKLTPSLFQ